MQFIDTAPFYKLVRVTGPKHNLLVLKLTTTPSQDGPVVQRLDAEQASSNPILEEEVREQVLRAIEDFREKRGAAQFVELIQYLGSDSRPVESYYLMTHEILRRLEGSKVD